MFIKSKILIALLTSMIANWYLNGQKAKVICERNMKISQVDTISKEVVEWVENYYIKHNRFEVIASIAKKPVTRKNIKEWYYISPIESQNFDSVQVSIFFVGVDLSHSKEDLLVQKKYKNKNSNFKIMDDTLRLNNTVRLYTFFNRYSKFSDRAKVLCYEKIIINEYNK